MGRPRERKKEIVRIVNGKNIADNFTINDLTSSTNMEVNNLRAELRRLEKEDVIEYIGSERAGDNRGLNHYKFKF